MAYKSTVRTFLLAAMASLMLVSCGEDAPEPSAPDDALTAENQALKEEVAALKAQVEELKLTPAALLSTVDAAVKAGDLELAKKNLATLEGKFVHSREAQSGAKLISSLEEKKKAEEREAARIAALGLKALKVDNVYQHKGLKLALLDASIANRWTFDGYDDSYHYVEAERGSKYVTARLSYNSKEKDPNLFGMGAYVVENGKLHLRGKFTYRFARWMDYGTYLGNEPDFRNDFAHSATIPFSAAVQLENEHLKRPVYIVVSNQGCHTRSYDRFGNPPVSYYGECSGLRQILAPEDFKNGEYAILRRIN